MINDKRIDELKAEIEEQKSQLKRQAQIIVEKDKQIRELQAEQGIMERAVLIAYSKLTGGAK